MRKSSILIMLAMLLCSNVWGYGNSEGNGLGGAHRIINRTALKRFIQQAKNDPILKYYNFEPKTADYKFKPNGKDHPFVVEGKAVTESGDWYKSDLLIPENLPWLPTFIKEDDRRMEFTSWIIEGGYSADEPESYMALRHFYDPTGRAFDKVANTSASYLTDDMDPYISPLLMGKNPKINAKDWALEKSPYSLSEGYSAEYKALTVPVSEKSAHYAKAWRCFGEAMHLLADMTVPAHVRNDSHPGALSERWQKIKNLKADPYEIYVNSKQVEDYANYTFAPALKKKIDKCQSSTDLFDMIASYTNSNFFSVDTITGKDKHSGAHVANFNGQPKEYDAPKLDDYIFEASEKSDGSGYYKSRDGAYSIARRRSDGSVTLDDACVMDQARRLIPIAVAANVKLIDCFIPRVRVALQSFDESSKAFKCHVSAYAWDEKASGYVESKTAVFPAIEYNAAGFLTMGNVCKKYWLPIDKVNGGDFDVLADEMIKDIAAAVQGGAELTGAKIAVGIDMGGILVKSNTIDLQPDAPPSAEKPKPTAPKKLAEPKAPAPKPLETTNGPNPLVERSRVVDFCFMALGKYNDGVDRGLVIQIPGGTATWGGLSFNTSGSRERGSGKESWTISGTVSKDYQTLTALTAEHTVTTGSGTLTEKVIVKEVNRSGASTDSITFGASAENAKKCVVTVDSTWKNDGSSQPSRSLVSYEMTDSSMLQVGFAR